MTTAEPTNECRSETASPVDRVGCETTPTDSGSQVAGEVCFLTLADAAQQEKEAWMKFKWAEQEMEATPLAREVAKLRAAWAARSNMVQAIKAAEKLNCRVVTGFSQVAVPCGQADHLRDAMATERPTANEAY